MGTVGKRSERGAVLILVLALLALLTLSGLMVLDSTGVQAEAAGSERSSEDALFIAEAGLEWAQKDLSENYSIDIANPSADFVTLLASLPTQGADAECHVNTCLNWKRLHAATSIVHAGGYFRVFLKDDDFGEGTNPNKTILMRSLGVAQNGSKRMIEVAFTTNAP